MEELNCKQNLCLLIVSLNYDSKVMRFLPLLLMVPYCKPDDHIKGFKGMLWKLHWSWTDRKMIIKGHPYIKDFNNLPTVVPL